jgi:hypothetical protein
VITVNQISPRRVKIGVEAPGSIPIARNRGSTDRAIRTTSRSAGRPRPRGSVSIKRCGGPRPASTARLCPHGRRGRPAVLLLFSLPLSAVSARCDRQAHGDRSPVRRRGRALAGVHSTRSERPRGSGAGAAQCARGTASNPIKANWPRPAKRTRTSSPSSPATNASPAKRPTTTAPARKTRLSAHAMRLREVWPGIWESSSRFLIEGASSIFGPAHRYGIRSSSGEEEWMSRVWQFQLSTPPPFTRRPRYGPGHGVPGRLCRRSLPVS